MDDEISEIKFDKNFIKKLLEKLKVGNTRSIHLNCVPGRSATRLDLFQLSQIDKNIPSEFIETLLSEDSFSFTTTFDKVDLGELEEDEKKKLVLLAKRLNTLVIENNDNFLEFGIKNFGFGYPLLIKRDKNDPSKIIKAPLFIWHLDIERSYQNKNTWTIKKDEDSPIKLNELLVSHLSKDESIQLGKIPKEILEDGILDKEELISLCKNILSQLNSEPDNLESKIEKCPDTKTFEAISNSKPWIQWSGVFGIYRSQKETIINSTQELLDRFEEFQSEDLILKRFQTSTVSAVEMDPSKEEIINTLMKDEIKLIQGPPGTGKSQSITAIISNALANKAKCLVVCEKKTALDVIQSNLENAGLGNFSIVIDDVNKDRRKVIEKARNIKENPEWVQFHELDFDEKYKKFENIKNDLNKKYKEPLAKIFGDFTWKELIGLYLRFSKSDHFDAFLEKLDYDILNFQHEEYVNYLNKVEEASFLFSEMEIDSEILFKNLESDLFKIEYKWSAQDRVKNDINGFSTLLVEINSFIDDTEDCSYALKEVSLFNAESLESSTKLVESTIHNLELLIKSHKEGLDLIGEKFNKKGSWQNFSFSMGAIFSSKTKEAVILRKDIISLIKQISTQFEQLSSFGFVDLEIKEFEELDDFLGASIDSDINLKKTKTIRTGLKKVGKTKDALEKLESKLNKINLDSVFDFQIDSYKELGSKDALEKYYQDFESRINRTKSHIGGYESFHNWMFFILKCNEIEQKIIRPLKQIPTEEWKNLFKAWYYRGSLLHYEDSNTAGFNKSDAKLNQLQVLGSELKEQQIRQIKYIWENRRAYEFRNLNHNFNALYNLRKNKAFGRRNSLRKLIETDLNLFTTIFPVVLINPDAVNAIFPLEQGLFEVVIFDEASQLRVSDTFTSLIRGQYKIIAGDQHQMPPSNYFQSSGDPLETDTKDDDELFSEDDENAVLAESESLLQYAEDLKIINKSYLDFHYRSNHPALIEFSNCAFYGGNLISFPETEAYKPIDFRHIGGTYESNTNPSEVAEVLNIIRNEIHPDHNGKYPSIGIATFNINQRNLITEAINECAENDLDFAKKAQELKERGLFVKNLENIQGDEKDIIIISTTYGIKPDGKFTQNFARLNRIEGYKLLNVLVTRAKKKLYVCTSIPKEKYIGYAELIKHEGNNKKGILYAYLSYAEAISSHDNDLAASILRQLKENSYEKPRAIFSNDGLSESPFEEEVYSELLEHFDVSEIIQQHNVGGFRLDFLINSNENQIVLECDGKAYHQSEEAHAHDMYRQKELENIGFIVYRIWSTNWFQDKESEIKKFLRFCDSLNKK